MLYLAHCIRIQKSTQVVYFDWSFNMFYVYFLCLLWCFGI